MNASLKIYINQRTYFFVRNEFRKNEDEFFEKLL